MQRRLLPRACQVTTRPHKLSLVATAFQYSSYSRRSTIAQGITAALNNAEAMETRYDILGQCIEKSFYKSNSLAVNLLTTGLSIEPKITFVEWTRHVFTNLDSTTFQLNWKEIGERSLIIMSTTSIDKMYTVFCELVSRNVVLSERVVSKLVCGAVYKNQIMIANRILETAQKQGVELSIVSKQFILLAYCNAKQLEYAYSCYEQIIRSDQDIDIGTYAIFLATIKDEMARHRPKHYIRYAQRVLQQLEVNIAKIENRKPSFYNYVILVAARIGDYATAQLWFDRLLKHLRPDIYSLSSTALAYKNAGVYDKAIEILQSMKSKYDISPNLTVLNIWMDCIIASKGFEESFEFLKAMKPKYGVDPSGQSYTALIVKFYDHIDQILAHMKKSGLAETIAIKTAVISSNIRAGHLEKAWELYESMKKSQETPPDIYTVMALVNAFNYDGQKMNTLFNDTLKFRIPLADYRYRLFISYSSACRDYIIESVNSGSRQHVLLLPWLVEALEVNADPRLPQVIQTQLLLERS